MKKMTLSFCVVIIASLNVFAQEVTTDPFFTNQTELGDRITEEWDRFWNNCNRLVRTPIDSKEEVESYLGCLYGNLPSYFRFWAKANEDALSEAGEIIKQFISENMPAGDNAATERQTIVQIAVYSHQKLTAWHQRFADLANALGTSRFFVSSEVTILLQEIQKSYEKCSSISKEFVEELKRETSYSREGLQIKCYDYLSQLFESPLEVIEKYLGTTISATRRSERQYPTFLTRSGTDFRQFARGYDEFFNNVFSAFENCANKLWEVKQQQ